MMLESKTNEDSILVIFVENFVSWQFAVKRRDTPEMNELFPIYFYLLKMHLIIFFIKIELEMLVDLHIDTFVVVRSRF